mmetsp:Transcript_59485/g.169151  ORF Transcript_59485/g.169151 Transcript_59485/m.169151 type:complete len:177 (+) Transcript_59485:601-1131(+)
MHREASAAAGCHAQHAAVWPAEPQEASVYATAATEATVPVCMNIRDMQSERGAIARGAIAPSAFCARQASSLGWKKPVGVRATAMVSLPLVVLSCLCARCLAACSPLQPPRRCNGMGSHANGVRGSGAVRKKMSRLCALSDILHLQWSVPLQFFMSWRIGASCFSSQGCDNLAGGV